MSTQKIVGFHQDLEQHWVADLSCGHGQHMRHNPPFTNRPWTQTQQGRDGYLGTPLECLRCEIHGAYLQRDIRDENDIALLVRSFYEKLMSDPIIEFYFTDVAKIDVHKHLAKIVQFWNKILFKAGDYSGKPFDIHRELDKQVSLSPEHFQHWVFLFIQSVEDLFEGERANKIIELARGIANAMSTALNSESAKSVKHSR
ncbi:MAG: DUF3565 domain-containing protein [Pseudomonadales bacterium]|nr:DUF3565 domain-containing protein [Pseudomonadales bacterium]